MKHIPHLCETKISISDQMWEELLSIGTIVKSKNPMKEIEMLEPIVLWYSAEKQATLVRYKGVTLVFEDVKETEEISKFLSELCRTGHFSPKTCHQEVPYLEQTWNDLFRFSNDKKGASNGDAQEVREE